MNPNLENLLEPISVSPKARSVFDAEPPKPLYQSIFNYAQSINVGVTELGKLTAENNGGSLTTSLLHATTYCIELLLKAYIASDHKDVFSKKDLEAMGFFIDDQCYSELFDQISETKQEGILGAFGFALKIPELDKATFKNILEAQRCDNTYEEWRTIFESPLITSINLNFLLDFSNSLGASFSGLNQD